MTTVETRARVAADGTITVPVGREEAGTEVIVTVAPAPKTLSREEWVSHINRTQGRIDDPTFVRPEQGSFEVRDALT